MHLRGTGWLNYAEKLDDESGNEPEEVKTDLTNMTVISEALRDRKMLKCPKNVSHAHLCWE